MLFRDEASYQYTLDERMKQSGTVQISSTTATQKVRQPTQVGQPLQTTTQSQARTVMREESEVAKKVADARTTIIVWEKEYPVKREGAFR